MKLKNKTIVVTGGSMGIGLAIAEQCAREGARLILVSRHKKELVQAINSLTNISKTKHSYYVLDVSQEGEVKKFANKLKKEKRTINGLVNCAGIHGPIGKLGDIDLKTLKRTIEINLLGSINMCHYLIESLTQSKRGKIVNLAGGGATSPFPNYSAYAISKVGIVRFTENIACEYPNFDINAIAPGFVITRMHNETIKAGEKAGSKHLARTKMEMGKGGTSPDLAARLAVFLLSKESDGITGKLISAPWDSWKQISFQNKLKKEQDFCTLRRIDNQFYLKK